VEFLYLKLLGAMIAYGGGDKPIGIKPCIPVIEHNFYIYVTFCLASEEKKHIILFPLYDVNESINIPFVSSFSSSLFTPLSKS